MSFSFDGNHYEIDLSDDNAEALREAFSDYVAAARKVSGRQNPHQRWHHREARQLRRAREDPRVGERKRPRGLQPRRISQAVRDAYDAAH